MVKAIYVDEEIHKRVKQEATKNDMSIKEYVEEVLLSEID